MFYIIQNLEKTQGIIMDLYFNINRYDDDDHDDEHDDGDDKISGKGDVWGGGVGGGGRRGGPPHPADFNIINIIVIMYFILSKLLL